MLIAFHEAAHAVVAESLVPGSLTYVTLDPTRRGLAVVPTGAEACIQVDVELMPAGFEFAACVAASAGGEDMVPHLIDPSNPTRTGDEALLSDLRRLEGVNVRKARRKAREIVADRKDDIRRLADVLLERRYLTGDQVRWVLCGWGDPKTESQTESQGTHEERDEGLQGA